MFSDIPADNLDHLHSSFVVLANPCTLCDTFACCCRGCCWGIVFRNISFQCLSIHPRPLRPYCALSTLLTIQCYHNHHWDNLAHLASLDPYLLRLYELQAFFLAGARCLSAGHHLRLTRGPAGNRTTTGSLDALPTEPRGHLPLRAASRQLRDHVEGSLTFETSRPTWVSVQDVVLKTLRNKRPSTHTKSIDPRAQPLLPHTDKQEKMSLLLLLCSLLACHVLHTKQMRSRILTSFCQLHKKKDQKHMSSQKVFTS